MDGHSGGFGQGYHFYVNTDNTLRLDISFVAGINSTLTIPDTGWHHVGFQRRASDSKWIIWLDNSSEELGTNSPFGNDTNAGMVIGGRMINGTITPGFSGTLAYTGYWTQLLSGANITDLYDGDLDPWDITTSLLLAMDYPDGDLGNNNTGSLGDFTTNGTITYSSDDPFGLAALTISVSDTVTLSESKTVAIEGVALAINVSDSITLTESTGFTFNPLAIYGAGPLAPAKFRGIDQMKYTKDLIRNQPTDQFIEDAVNFVAQNFNISHIAISISMDTDADYTSEGVSPPSPRTVNAFIQKWADTIHAAGKKVLWRMPYNFMEKSGATGLYDFLIRTGATRYDLGTTSSAATDGTATLYGRIYKFINDNPTFFETGDIWAPFPERTETNISTRTITSLTRSGSTATANTSGNHDIGDNQPVRTYGATQAEYNGDFQINKVDDDTFEYTVTGTPASPATGSPQVDFGVSPYYTAHSAWPHTGGAQAGYSAFFIDLATVSRQAFLANGKNVYVGLSAQNWSEIDSGWLQQTLFDTFGITSFDHYGTEAASHSVAEMETDWDDTYTNVGNPMFHQEWSDYWNGTTYDDTRFAYLRAMYAAAGVRVANGKIIGFNYWGGWDGGTGEQILSNSGTGSDPTFSLLPTGLRLQEAFNGVADTVNVYEYVNISLDNTLSINVTDSITVTESVAMFTDILYRSVSDTITVTENVDPELNSFIAVSDTITLTENTEPELVSFINVSDTVTVSENISVGIEGGSPGDISFSVSDSITITENTDPELVSFVAVSDNITLTESVDPELVSDITVSDTITLSESIDLENNLNIAITARNVLTDNMAATISGTLKGDATHDTVNEWVQLTSAVNNQSGQIEYTDSTGLITNALHAQFQLFASGSADAIYLYWGGSTTPTGEDSAHGGYTVAYDEFTSEIQIKFNGTTIASVSQGSLGNGTWRTADIYVVPITSGTRIRVYLDGIFKLGFDDTTRVLPGALYGLGSRTGGQNATHRVRLFTVDNLSQAELVQLTESKQMMRESYIAKSETVTVTENVSLLIPELFVTVSDTITLSESVQTLLTSFISVNDTITLTENTAASLVPLIGVSDTVTLTENNAMMLDANVVASEDITVTEDITVIIGSPSATMLQVADSIAVTEAVTIEPLEMNISVSDTVTITESVNAALVHLRSVEDTVTLDEAVNLALVHTVAVQEDIEVTENVVMLSTLNLAVSDSITLTESVGIALSSPSIAVSEDITITESVTLLIPELYLSVSDEIEVTDTPALQGIVPLITVSDNITVSENISMFTDILYLAVSDTITVSDFILFQSEYNKNQPFYYYIGQNLSIMLGPPRAAVWGTNGRPQNPIQGEWGYNDELARIELWDGSQWLYFGGTPFTP